MTSASELAKFIRSKCNNKYSKHPIHINPSYRSMFVEKTIFKALESTRLHNLSNIDVNDSNPYFSDIYKKFKIQMDNLIFDFSLGFIDKITLSDKHFTAETDLFWTNYSQSVAFEIKDRNWEYEFANFGDIIQISVFAYLNKKITGIETNCYIYYAPNDKLFQISPVSYNDLLIIENKYNYRTTLDLQLICGNYHICNCFENIGD